MLPVSLRLWVIAGIAQSVWTQQATSAALPGPTTGSVAQYGDIVRTGAMAAIDAINKAGGVNGAKLQGVVYDDACDPVSRCRSQQSGQRQSQVRDCHVCSGATQAAEDVRDEGVLMITPSATAPNITTRYKLVFRTIGLDSDQGPARAYYIASQFMGKNIAILHDKQ